MPRHLLLLHHLFQHICLLCFFIPFPSLHQSLNAFIIDSSIYLMACREGLLRELPFLGLSLDPGKEFSRALRVEAIGHYSLPFEVSLIRGESNLPAPGPDYAVSAVADMNFSRAASIYGGSNEIQRNVMAKGVLGL